MSSGTLDPVFVSNTTGYTVTVDDATTTIDVTATPTVNGATLTIDGQPAASGSPVAVPLAVGATDIAIEVTSADTTTKRTYTITVTRLPAL